MSKFIDIIIQFEIKGIIVFLNNKWENSNSQCQIVLGRLVVLVSRFFDIIIHMTYAIYLSA
jgi:hypothetical protein